METIITALYADGGVVGGNPSHLGTWAYRLIGYERRAQRSAIVVAERAGVITPEQAGLDLITNNLTELWALVSGLMRLPEGWAGHVYSDSQITLGRLFRGWRRVGIPAWLSDRADAALSRIHAAGCTPVLLKGHPTAEELSQGEARNGRPVSVHNVWCDAACAAAGQEYLASLERRAR